MDNKCGKSILALSMAWAELAGGKCLWLSDLGRALVREVNVCSNNLPGILL